MTADELELRRARLKELGLGVIEGEGECRVVRGDQGHLIALVRGDDPVEARAEAIAQAERELRLDPIDSALADTFPASDPTGAGQAGL